MRTIWKFALKTLDQQYIPMPVLSYPLSVQIQHGELVMWAVVEPDDIGAQMKVLIVGTGHPMPAGAFASNYIGTVQDGGLVWHVFNGGVQMP